MPNIEWDTAASGAWNDAADWTGGAYPDSSTDDVTIGTQGVYIVTLAAGTSYQIGGLLVSNADAELLLGGSLGMSGSLETQGQILLDNGIIDDQGTIYNAGLFSGFGDVFFLSLDNTGTISTAGTLGDYEYLGGYSGAVIDNTGVLAATGIVLELGGVDLLNLVDGTLSGGTYIASTGSDGYWGWIEWFGGNASTISEDDASITLSGGSDIGEWVSSAHTLIGIEQTLDSIGSAGTLALEQSEIYTNALSLSLSGLLVLDGSSFAAPGLVIAGGGTLLAEGSSAGFDYISAPITNDGLIAAASGSVLFLKGSLQGDVAIAGGATIEAYGGSIASTFSDNGFLVDSGGNLYVNTVAGAGAIALEQGSTLFVSNLGSASVAFGGADAAIDMSSFSGTIAHFGPTNRIIVTGRTGDSLALNGDELQLMNSSTSEGSLIIEGSLTGTVFSITSHFGNETITATPPAQTTYNPGPSYFNYSVSVDNLTTVAGAGIATLISALDDALSIYADDVYGLGTLTVGLTIGDTATTQDELADGGAVYGVPTGTIINGNMLDEYPSVFELTTGEHYDASLPDIYINVPSYALEAMIGYAEAVSLSAANYAVEVFEHELTHGFDFGSVLNAYIGTYSGYENVWDSYLSFASDGLYFTGPAAEAVNGGPVAVTTLANGEAYSHLANSDSDPNAHDLMSGLGITPGDTISAIDLAILQDVGVPVVNPVQTACYAAGTHILAPRGEVAVEDLIVGEAIVAQSGQKLPIKWMGYRRVDCRRHPKPQDVWPVRIMAGAFGPGMPYRDLWLSPDHAVFAEGVLIPIRYLINGATIVQEERDEVTYWHVELAQHNLLIAEGLPCESYLDSGGRRSFVNGGSVVQLHADFGAGAYCEAVWEASACAPLRIEGRAVNRVVARLRRRARELGFTKRSRNWRSSAVPRGKLTSDLAELIKPAWYLAVNPDVAAAGADAATHYTSHGRFEGRRPCSEVELFRGLGLVDPGSFVFTMPDVITAGVDPVEHFCAIGWIERRNPNPYFDTGWYLDTHDVPAGMNALLHYLLFGENQGFAPSRHFDPAWYRARYGIKHTASPLAHYLMHRRTQRFSPVPSFDVVAYRRAHAAVMRPARDPYAHFLAVGQFPTAGVERKSVASSAIFTRTGKTRKFKAQAAL